MENILAIIISIFLAIAIIISIFLATVFFIPPQGLFLQQKSYIATDDILKVFCEDKGFLNMTREEGEIFNYVICYNEHGGLTEDSGVWRFIERNCAFHLNCEVIIIGEG